MTQFVLITGAGGFVGQALFRCAGAQPALRLASLSRSDAASQIKKVRAQNNDDEINVVNLAWPSLGQYSASTQTRADGADEWQDYCSWVETLIDATAGEGGRFFQIGSGVEAYADGPAPQIGDPYLTYAKRKSEIWQKVQDRMPDAAWRLRLHFLFGPGEAAHRFVPSAIKAARNGETLRLGAPERQRHWLHIDDAATGVLEAITASNPDSWDICGPAPISFADLASLIGAAAGSSLRLEQDDRNLPDAGLLHLAPANLAPFMPDGIGEQDNLRSRLKEYAGTLSS